MTTVSEEVVKAMPERIYAVKQTEGSNCVVSFDTPSLDYNVEYVRADLALPHLPGVGVKKLDLTVLERLADYAEQYDHPDENGPFPDIQDVMVTVGDLRQARKLLSILSALEPSAARKLALGEAAKLLEREADELDGLVDSVSHHLRSKAKTIRALSSPDHADAGKLVEGDGAKWPIREVVAKAIAYHAVGDPHARTIRGDQRWEWFTDEADKFISVFGCYLPSAPSHEVAGS